MKAWYGLEIYAHDAAQLEKLHKSYEKIYGKYKAVGSIQVNKLAGIRKEMEYLVLRLSFINPVNLPVMTESFLRKDFHFAMYLSYCYGKVLTKFFKWSLFSLILLLFLIITLNLTFDAIQDQSVRLYIKFTGLIVCFIVLILLKSCLTTAERKITPSVYNERTNELRDPDNFNVCFNDRDGMGVCPFAQADELPRMPYLDFDQETTELNNSERE